MAKNSCRRRRRRFLPNRDPMAPAGSAAGSFRGSRLRGEATRYRRAAFGGTCTVNRLRPLRRRRFSTFCPPGVAMRARKPCARFRRRLLGWYVRFIRYSSFPGAQTRAASSAGSKIRAADASSASGHTHHTAPVKSNQ